MIIDKKSLKDLEIFESSGVSIVELFDKTKTDGGSFRLKEIFRVPLKTHKEIEKRQELLKWLKDNIQESEFIFQEDHILLVEQYLSSNIVPMKKGNCIKTILKGIHFISFYKNHYNQLYSNVLVMRKFLIRLEEFYSKIIRNNTPETLKNETKTIQSLLEDKRIKEIIKKHQNGKVNFYRVFLYDEMFRVQLSKLIRKAIGELHLLDALISIVKVMDEKEMSFPKVIDSEESVLDIKGLFHLAVEKPVKNDFSIDKHLVFLTGANMSGKTTFMKSVGTAVYLAQLGIGVPAEEMTLTKFDGIITGIETEDNIRLGYSFFYSEVQRVKESIQMIKENNNVLLIFDEMFKGTNLTDAFNASERVIKGLAKKKKGIYFISSHLIELEEALNKTKEIVFKCFKISEKDSKIKYTYKIEDGVSADRLGMYIMEESGVFSMLES